MEYLSWEDIPSKGACSTRSIQNVKNSHDLGRGRPRSKGFPSDAYFQMNPDYPKDIKLVDQVCNIGHFILVSSRMAEFLRTLNLNNTEFLPVSILNHREGVAAEDYFVIHPCEIVDCIDKFASEIRWNNIDPDLIASVFSLEFKESSIPEDVLVFRPFAIAPTSTLFVLHYNRFEFFVS